MNPLIFREYDIRGVADRDLPDELVRDLGRAVGTFLGRRGLARAALGRDCRLSSPRMHAAMRAGLLETGLSLVDIGVVPTPLMYFSVWHRDLDGGVQITGSHNPPADNGFKMMAGKGTLSRRGHPPSARDDRSARFRSRAARRGGRDRSATLVRGLHARQRSARANGSSVRRRRRQRRGRPRRGRGDARRRPVPSRAALSIPTVGSRSIIRIRRCPRTSSCSARRVLEDHLELGIAYDGDADRIGVIDARGDVMWGDRLMVVFSRALLSRSARAPVLGEVKCSQTLYDDVAAHGGRPILWKTGHSLIKAEDEGGARAARGRDERPRVLRGPVLRVRRRDLRLASAPRDTGARRPGPSTSSSRTCRARTPRRRSECRATTSASSTSSSRILERYRATHSVVDIDGARILFEGGWGLVRASNTQPVLVMRFEADSEPRLAEIRADVEGAVREAT